MIQEIITFSIVALAFGNLMYRFYQSVLAAPLSKWLLSRGQVSLAMKIRNQRPQESQCGNCKCH